MLVLANEMFDSPPVFAWVLPVFVRLKGLLFEVVHLHAQGGVRDRGLVFLWQVKLALLLEAHAGVALTQDLEGRPMLGELLRDTALMMMSFICSCRNKK